MPVLRIRLVTTGGVAATAIRAAQLGYPFTHAEVAVPSGYLGAKLAGGVAIRPVGYDAGPRTVEQFIELDVCKKAAEAFYGFLHAQLGKPYDVGAIVDFIKGVFVPASLADPGTWLEPTRWFCSELVAAALIQAGVLPDKLLTWERHVTPQLLAVEIAGMGRVITQTVAT